LPDRKYPIPGKPGIGDLKIDKGILDRITDVYVAVADAIPSAMINLRNGIDDILLVYNQGFRGV
jgi:hypothetical protein